jgi:hypothetical protein
MIRGWRIRDPFESMEMVRIFFYPVVACQLWPSQCGKSRPSSLHHAGLASRGQFDNGTCAAPAWYSLRGFSRRTEPGASCVNLGRLEGDQLGYRSLMALNRVRRGQWCTCVGFVLWHLSSTKPPTNGGWLRWHN